jgi:hypothetical protein
VRTLRQVDELRPLVLLLERRAHPKYSPDIAGIRFFETLFKY